MSEQNLESIKKILSSRPPKTNCFLFFNEICVLMDTHKADFYLKDENSVFMFLNTNGFFKFYYFVNNFKDIALAKPLLDEYYKKSDVSLEFITKNDRFLEELKEAIYPIGFKFYAEFARFSDSKTCNIVDRNNTYLEFFQIATPSDADEILTIMYREFDKIKDDIMTKDELLNLIKDQTVLIRKSHDKIIFINIYQLMQNALYSRMSWIDKNFRKPDFAVEIYSAADMFVKIITKNETIRHYYWINKMGKAFKIAQVRDIKPDGLTNNIFIYKSKK
jgi:hypothetical protein